MRSSKIVAGVIQGFIVLPIWLYVVYTLLSAAHVDRLVWFLFWIYIPATIFVVTIQVIISGEYKK